MKIIKSILLHYHSLISQKYYIKQNDVIRLNSYKSVKNIKRIFTLFFIITPFLIIPSSSFSKVLFMKDGSVKEYIKIKKITTEKNVILKHKEDKIIENKKVKQRKRKMKKIVTFIITKADKTTEEISSLSVLRIGGSTIYKYNVKYYLYKFKKDKKSPLYKAIVGYIVDDRKNNGNTYTMRKEINSIDEFFVKKYDIKYITMKPSPKGPKLIQKSNELGRDILGKKTEGWYIFPLPFVLGSSDNGIYPFIRFYFTDSGSKKDDNWIYSDYKYRILGQALISFPNLWQCHFIEVDIPYFMGTKIHVKASAIFEDTPNKQYYGIGRNILRDPSPTATSVFTQSDLIPLTTKNNLDYNKFYKYKMMNPMAYIDLYYNILDWLKISGGVEYKFAWLQKWDGLSFEYEGAHAISNQTLFDIDGLSHKKDGGSLIILKAGIGIDTRDFTSDPKKGIYMGYKGIVGFHIPEILRTDYNPVFHKSSFDFRIYWSPFKYITLAGKLGYTTTIGQIPFYELGKFQFFGGTENGIGGYKTSRGFPTDRFIDKTMMIMQLTIRWHIWEGKDPLTKSLWGFKLLGFFDVGRYSNTAYGVFSDNWINRKNLKDWNSTPMSYGFGCIISQNQSLLLHAYFGWSAEGMSFDFNVGHSI